MRNFDKVGRTGMKLGHQDVHSASWRPPTEGTAYEVLGVAPSADARELKARYYKIARAWHPDVSKHSDAPVVFARITQAYEIVTHPQQRLVYDFVLANEIPLTTPDRFLSFYATASRIDALIRHRHSIGWAIAGTAGALVVAARWRSLRPPPLAETVEMADAPVAPAAPAAPVTATAAPRPSIAAGGLLGAAGGSGVMLALGVAGAPGARFTLVASAAGALGGRALTAWLEARVGRMRTLSTRTAEALATHGRPLCEASGAVIGLLLLRRASPALRLAEAHLRVARVALLGALGGHVVGRLSVHSGESPSA